VSAPREPYEPDVDPDVAPPTALGDLVDVAVTGADWSNSQALRAALNRVTLSQCRLTGSELAEGSLTDVLFDGCRLDLVGLRFARLERVVFRECRLNEADLHAAHLRDVLFDRCELRGAVFTGLSVERVEIAGGDLAGLRGAEALRGVRMGWNDVLANAPLFAGALGIDIVDDD
jgi:uncharacterized protein YjbI with pentapeptide repeats